jgi:hypothetical protein
MNTTLLVMTVLTESRTRHALALVVFGCLVAVLILSWSYKLSRAARNLPLILFTGIVPLFLLAVLWPQMRRTLLASLGALLVWSCLSRRSRRLLRLPMTLFVGLIPLFLLLGVDDASWCLGFLAVYLGLINNHTDGENEMPTGLASRTRHFVYCVSVGFLWILVLAALLWYVAEPVTWHEV